MHPKTVMLFSLISLFFLASKLIPVYVGEPLGAFFAMLFYYAIGWASIGYFFILEIFVFGFNFPQFVVLSQALRENLLSVVTDGLRFCTPYTNFLPEDKAAILAENIRTLKTIVLLKNDFLFSIEFFLLAFYIMLFAGLFVSLLSCRWAIKRYHLDRRIKEIWA